MIDYMVRSSSVQVHHMKSANTVRFKFLGNFHRIFVIYFLTVIISLGKAYTLSVNNINGWNNFYHLLFICYLTIYSSLITTSFQSVQHRFLSPQNVYYKR